MEVAKTGKGIEEEGGAVFDVTKFQLDYLTTPSGFLDIGIDYNKTDITTRACQTDELYIIAYPHFNVNGIHSMTPQHAAVDTCCRCCCSCSFAALLCLVTDARLLLNCNW